jgi:hypothetical protein
MDEEERAMREQVQDMHAAMELPGFKIGSPGSWGGMVVEHMECADKTDMGPILEGLPGDLCPCPHWGYMVKGALHIRYADNTEEVFEEGDAFYMPAGHTGWSEAGSAMIYFSPEAEASQVAEHVARKLQG